MVLLIGLERVVRSRAFGRYRMQEMDSENEKEIFFCSEYTKKIE